MKKRILYLLLAVLVGIQLIRIDKTPPEADPKWDFFEHAPADVAMGELIRSTCYDCHSYQTTYPWYAHIAPVSWWLQNHVHEGREHLNFSLWSQYEADKRDHKLEECAEEVEEGHMPISSYTWMHTEARLSKAQREQLAEWFEAQR